MDTFKDFVAWAGGRPKAAALIGIDKFRAHRLFHGADITKDEAIAIEKATGGVFKKESLIFPASDNKQHSGNG